MLNPVTTLPDTTLERWNSADAEAAANEILPCCGSRAWADAVTARRPFASAGELFTISDRSGRTWRKMTGAKHSTAIPVSAKMTRSELAPNLWPGLGEEQRAAMTPDEFSQAVARRSKQ